MKQLLEEFRHWRAAAIVNGRSKPRASKMGGMGCGAGLTSGLVVWFLPGSFPTSRLPLFLQSFPGSQNCHTCRQARSRGDVEKELGRLKSNPEDEVECLCFARRDRDLLGLGAVLFVPGCDSVFATG